MQLRDLAGLTPEQVDAARRRFIAKVVEHDGHWLWRAPPTVSGHTWFRVDAHHGPMTSCRAAWLLWRGELRSGYVVVPCATACCISPWCAEELDARVHRLRSIRFANAASRGCQRPQARKLDDARARAILRLSRSGWLRRQIAAKLDVSRSLVDHVVSGRAWWWATGLRRKPMRKRIAQRPTLVANTL